MILGDASGHPPFSCRDAISACSIAPHSRRVQLHVIVGRVDYEVLCRAPVMPSIGLVYDGLFSADLFFLILVKSALDGEEQPDSLEVSTLSLASSRLNSSRKQLKVNHGQSD